jgi:hypothetical protein
MKKLLLLMLFISSVSFAQNNYIIDKKGTKLYVRDDQTEVILIDKRISYMLVGKTWEKYIKFDDLDYAVVGSSVLKSFKLDKSKKSKVFFVLGEKENMKLIGVTIVVTTSSGSHSSSRTFYNILVIDNEDNIIEQINADSGKSKDNAANIDKIAPMIRKNFSDCPQVMSKLSEYENSNILGFITDTQYIKCN